MDVIVNPGSATSAHAQMARASVSRRRAHFDNGSIGHFDVDEVVVWVYLFFHLAAP